MSNTVVRGFCKAGCAYRVPTYDEFLRSASMVEVERNEDGTYSLELGVEYKVVANTLVCPEGETPETTSGIIALMGQIPAIRFKSGGIDMPYELTGLFDYYHTAQRISFVETTHGLLCKCDYKDLTIGDASNPFENYLDESGKIIINRCAEVYKVNRGNEVLGKEGKSAYDVACENGFEGTEAQWLASLKGEQGEGLQSLYKKDTITVDLFDGYNTETVYLGKKDGVEQYGLFWTGAGTVGTAPSGSGYNACSNAIAVESGKTYILHGTGIVVAFDSEDNYMSVLGSGVAFGDTSFTIPDGCAFVRISLKTGDMENDTPHFTTLRTVVLEEIRNELMPSKLDKNLGAEGANSFLTTDKIGEACARKISVVSKNLFNRKTAHTAETTFLGYDANGKALEGWYLTGVGSVATEKSGSGVDSTSEAIAVEGGATYHKSSAATLNVFDENDKYIRPDSFFPMDAGAYIMPSNARYIRLGFKSADIDKLQFVKGEKPLPYEEYKEGIEDFSCDDYSNLSAVLSRNAVKGSYMGDYIGKIVAEANKHIASDRHTFIVMADTHSVINQYVMSIAANLTKYIPCSCIAHCGDIINGLRDKQTELNMLVDLARNGTDAACPVLYAKGNHDYNALYAENNGNRAEDYILNDELYVRTNRFFKDKIKGNLPKMYFYIDDEETKVRTIFLNTYDKDESIVNGERPSLQNTTTMQIGVEQYTWFINEALNFSDKGEGKNSWGVITVSHRIAGSVFYNIINALRNGGKYTGTIQLIDGTTHTLTADFAEQGAVEFIAAFVGDDHYDKLRVEANNVLVIHVLNASLARDNTNVPTASNGVLMPPAKTNNTEDETAFDIVTVDRNDKKLYLTRYGARSFVYNEETSAFDKIAARTRVLDYSTGEYITLLDV